MIRLINKVSETHETYTFLSKYFEASNNIIDDMLAKNYMDEESNGTVRVSISIGMIKLTMWTLLAYQ